MTLSLRWATATNYSTGPDAGTPTRVDPGSATNGFVRGVIAAPQHVNYLLGEILDYLHQVEEDPETWAEIKDDFMPGAYDSAAGLLHTDRTWRVTDGAAHSQGPVNDFADPNPGVHFCTIPATQSYELHLGEEIIPGLLQWGNLECATIVFGLFSGNFTGASVTVGLASQFSTGSIGSDSAALHFNKSLSNNWLLRHKHAGTDDVTDGGLLMTSGNFVVMKLKRVSATQVQVTLNGSSIATLTDGSGAPADSAGLNVGLVATAGASASMTIRWDLVHVRWTTASRQS